MPQQVAQMHAPDQLCDSSVTNRYELFLIIHHPHTTDVLCTQAPLGKLPCYATPPPGRAFYFHDTETWLPRIREYFGFTFDFTLLRCIWYRRYDEEDYEKRRFRAIVVMESHGENIEVPVGTEWMSPESIVFPEAALEEAGDIIEHFREECRTGAEPPLRPLFARRGWYDTAVEWAKEQLASNGYEDINAISQVKGSWRGAVFKIETTNGVAVFLKCNPFFINEASVYKELTKLIPKFVATPIAADVESCLLLMKDHGEILSPLRFGHEEKDVWANELAELHQSTIGHEQVLLDAGLRRLTLDVMEAEVDNMLDYAERMGVVSNEILEELRGFSEELKRNCRQVEEFGIPATFVHGDLYYTNAYRSKGIGASHGIIDFGESTVSHPFIDAYACGNHVPYYENWTSYLERTMPVVAQEMRKWEMRKYHSLCVIILAQLWEPVRLYQESKEVESPMPPQLQDELRGHLTCLLRALKPTPYIVRKVANANVTKVTNPPVNDTDSAP